MDFRRQYRGFTASCVSAPAVLPRMLAPSPHSAKLTKHRCRLDFRRYFFSERVVDRWNSLPQDVIDADSLNSFKNGLDRVRSIKMGFFMDYSRSAEPYGLICSLEQVRPHLVSYLVSYYRRVRP